ncbi:MAG: hypothetical protein RDU20_07920 [Desulfomonilaceae bacterium]|nr:hypothetical protein [Desulfomonilaceae bacterium]
MEIKIRIKVGDLEIEYEGPEDHLKKAVADMAAASEAFRREGPPRVELDQEAESAEEEAVPAVPERQPLPMTVATIAKTLRCSTGQDLVVAACASLTLVKQEDAFTREQIRLEMKEARKFYKDNYRKSLSKYLNALVRNGVLLEVDEGMYSIPAGTLAQLEDMLVS